MAKLLRDSYFWYLVVLAIVLGIIIYGDYIAFPGWLPAHVEWHLTYMVIGDIVFLAGVVIAAWRFGVKGGLVVAAFLGLVIVPHFIEMAVDSGMVDELLRTGIFIAVGVAFSWLVGTRKQAEEELRESEEKYRILFEESRDAVYITTQEGKVISANQFMLNLFDYTREEVIGLDARELYAHRDDRSRFQKEIEQKGFVRDYEMKLRKKDGTEMDCLTTATVRRANDGSILGYQGIIRDITERKRAEEALRESEELHRLTLSNISDAVFITDDAGEFTYICPNVDVIFDYSFPEVQAFGNITKLLGDDLFARNQLETLGEIRNIDWEITDKAGRGHALLVNVKRVSVKGGTTLYTCRDITERRQAEEREKQLQAELSHSSRLAAIGELAAGVAHEINNPLTGIIGFSQLLLGKITDKGTKRDLERIHNEGRRAAKIVENLLTFARRRESKKEYSDINDILQKTLELRAYELKTSNIKVETDLAPGLPQIMVDFYQIEEVFLNIIMNAEQAMVEANHKGKLSIKTQKTKDYISTSFTDDGPGISAENLDKLFNPFFTTRVKAGGTGLGLSVCHGIITKHGGKIFANSKLGKGTTFTVRLPVQ